MNCEEGNGFTAFSHLKQLTLKLVPDNSANESWKIFFQASLNDTASLSVTGLYTYSLRTLLRSFSHVGARILWFTISFASSCCICQFSWNSWEEYLLFNRTTTTGQKSFFFPAFISNSTTLQPWVQKLPSFTEPFAISNVMRAIANGTLFIACYFTWMGLNHPGLSRLQNLSRVFTRLSSIVLTN